MAGLINVQGLHAPLRLAMERRAVQQVGRLPFLPSSNLHLQVTLSYYTTIFECMQIWKFKPVHQSSAIASIPQRFLFYTTHSLLSDTSDIENL